MTAFRFSFILLPCPKLTLRFSKYDILIFKKGEKEKKNPPPSLRKLVRSGARAAAAALFAPLCCFWSVQLNSTAESITDTPAGTGTQNTGLRNDFWGWFISCLEDLHVCFPYMFVA